MEGCGGGIVTRFYHLQLEETAAAAAPNFIKQSYYTISGCFAGNCVGSHVVVVVSFVALGDLILFPPREQFQTAIRVLLSVSGSDVEMMMAAAGAEKGNSNRRRRGGGGTKADRVVNRRLEVEFCSRSDISRYTYAAVEPDTA